MFLLFILIFFAGCEYDVHTNITENEQVNNNKHEVLFYTDDKSGDKWFDVSNRTVLVNGVDRTADTTFVSTPDYLYVVYTPTDLNPLPQNSVNVYLTIPPENSNWWKFWQIEFETEVDFYVDSIAPVVSAISSEDGDLIADPLQVLTYSVTDVNGTGVDAVSLSVYINNTDRTEQATFEAGVLTFTPSSASSLPLSSFDLNVIAKDMLGNETNATFSYVVQPKVELGAFPRAIPESAIAPASIRFSPIVTTDTAIQYYAWDLDGDGAFERGDIVGNTYTYTYTIPGDYNVSLQVRDANGEYLVGSKIVHIYNLPPVVSAEATPSNGEIPLDVTFSVTATDNEGIGKYEWDFEGDGVYDYESVSTGSVLHTYTTAGEYAATVRVTDTAGASAIYTLPTTTINAATAGAPSVTASANVQSGTVPLAVSLNATASDPQGKAFTLWEWDFDGDGVYDYNSSQSAAVSHTFVSAGTHYPRVRVTTEDGRTAIDPIEIKVQNSISISRDLNTIDIALGENVDITTVLGGNTRISILIENKSNQLVRTLVDWRDRVAGTYTDSWDGLTADGQKLPEGDYYAILLYEEDGQTKRVDLRDSSGGSQYAPSRTDASSYYDRKIAPFDNDPMQVTVTLGAAAEVTAFVGYSTYGPDVRVATLFTRRVFPKGSHVIKWYSITNDGQFILPEGGYFMYGNWAYTLADNAIYVKSGAHITSVIASPAIYDPTSHKAGGLRDTLDISFNLTGDASVMLSVIDAETGILVAYKKYEDLSAGLNTVEWDGRNGSGEFIAPGRFTLGLKAVDETGYSSLTQYTMQRIYY